MAVINKDALKVGIEFKPCKDCDRVEVVRCKDCGAYLEYSHCEYMGLNGFCSLGFFCTPKERGGEK